MSRLAVSCHAPESNPLSDTYSSLFSIVFFSIHIPRYFQKFRKRHPQALIHSGSCVIFKNKSKFTNACTLFLLSYVHPCFVLAFCGLRADRKSVESHTRTVSYHVTLARESREFTSGMRNLESDETSSSSLAQKLTEL